ncbi:hypothetical protein AWN76_018035 [Rhodothermaceae bacterium RA]|nr:hypothetical protein AWN76_018035 [Rhodothermaceae bacterium RA]
MIGTLTQWEEIVRDPALQDLPYKIETNARGQLILSPHKKTHSHQQAQILLLLQHLRGGKLLVECAVRTSDGVKVADVAWASDERYEAAGSLFEQAPELCIEVKSEANTWEELAYKRGLYLAAGAREVWICDEAGTLRFFDADGERTTSALVPEAPVRL